jgi:hypothetical protein
MIQQCKSIRPSYYEDLVFCVPGGGRRGYRQRILFFFGIFLQHSRARIGRAGGWRVTFENFV